MDAVRDLLAMETWAVVGLSDNRGRAAWDVARFLKARGKKIVPVHPDAPTVFSATSAALMLARSVAFVALHVIAAVVCPAYAS